MQGHWGQVVGKRGEDSRLQREAGLFQEWQRFRCRHRRNVRMLGGKEEDHSSTDPITRKVQCQGPRVRRQKKQLKFYNLRNQWPTHLPINNLDKLVHLFGPQFPHLGNGKIYNETPEIQAASLTFPGYWTPWPSALTMVS